MSGHVYVFSDVHFSDVHIFLKVDLMSQSCFVFSPWQKASATPVGGRTTHAARVAWAVPAAAVAAVVLLSFAPGAVQADASPVGEGYGQLARFGGYEETGKELEKFVLPVGFAVDPNENAVYVLDLIVDEEKETEGTLQYRLQKLSSAGKLQASVVLPPDHFKVKSEKGAHPLWGLAVDSADHRVYALVMEIIAGVPVLERVVAWSTQPEGKKLVEAPGFKEKTDPITGGALVAGPSVLEHVGGLSEDLYLPQALTVDHDHNVVVETQHGVEFSAGRPVGGPMMLQQVTIEGTEGEKAGVLGEHFTAETIVAPQPKQVGDGLFTAQDGSLGLDIWTKETEDSRLADVQAKLSKPNAKLIVAELAENRDAALSIDNSDTIAYLSGYKDREVLMPYAAGSPVAQLTNKLDAARYAETFDSQQGSGFPGNRFEVMPFWLQGRSVEQSIGREGVRLFDENGRISTTLGAEKEGEPCYLGFARVALAAGANETVFALVQPNPEDENKGDEVVEFGPDSNVATQCPTDSREVEVNGTVASKVAVTEGAKVPFVVKLSNPGADTPFEFEWVFGDGAVETKKMEAVDRYHWPEPKTEHKYTEAGVHHAIVKIYGAFGTSEVPVEVTVSPEQHPKAVFSSPGGVAEEEVEFDASGSTAGSKIKKYVWNFGDGGRQVTTPNPMVKHVFEKAGSYTVSLKIVDEVGKSAEATPQTVVISEDAQEKAEREEHERPAPEQEQKEKETGTTTTSPVAPSAPLVVPSIALVKPKLLTNAQKLTNALRACKKESKKRRTSCIKLAERKYATKKHETKKRYETKKQ